MGYDDTFSKGFVEIEANIETSLGLSSGRSTFSLNASSSQPLFCYVK